MEVGGSAYMVGRSPQKRIGDSAMSERPISASHQIITQSALAASLGRPERWIRENLIRHGCPHARLGSEVLFHAEELSEWLRNRLTAAKPYP